MTCVLVTHDQEEAMTMADRIAVMSAGRILQVGAPREIYETPATRFVADFIGTVNLFDGTLVEDEPDHCVIEAHGRHVFYVEPRHHRGQGPAPERRGAAGEDRDLACRRRERTDANCFQGKVVESAYFGASSLYRVALADGSKLQVSVPNTERHGAVIKIGATVYAYCSAESLVVLAQLRHRRRTRSNPCAGSQALARATGAAPAVIGIPYVFLLLFFSLPFLVVLKISVSETEGVHFKGL